MFCLTEMTANESIYKKLSLKKNITFKILLFLFPWVCQMIGLRLEWVHKIYLQGNRQSNQFIHPALQSQLKAPQPGRYPSSFPNWSRNQCHRPFLSTNDAFLFSSNLTEVLLNAQHLEFFREFLRERKAESPLQFLVAIQKISTETNEKTYRSLFENIIRTFFHGKTSPGMHPPLLTMFLQSLES